MFGNMWDAVVDATQRFRMYGIPMLVIRATDDASRSYYLVQSELVADHEGTVIARIGKFWWER